MSARTKTAKTLALSTALLNLANCADPGPAKPGDNVCIATYNIDHTEIPDDQTILFFMRDRKIWKNTLTNRCFGLKSDTRGYTYSPTDPGSQTICSNLVTIRLNTYQSTCLLGPFTPYTPPPK